MNGWLEQSSAVTVTIGPFVDESNATTPETGLTIAQGTVLLSKNGGAFAQKNFAASCTTLDTSRGYYACGLDATDTATAGLLTLSVYTWGALPVRHDFLIVPGHVYGGLVDSTDTLNVDTHYINGSEVTGDGSANPWDAA